MTTSTPPTEIDLRSAYIELCTSVREIAQLVVAADAVRYEAPPGMASSRGGDMEISNPTADATIDARRMGLSNECRELTGFLVTTAHSLRSRKERLDRALARWEGDAPQSN